MKAVSLLPALLQHDSARPHTVHVTGEAIKDIHFKCLCRPSHSADHAVCDCCVFGALKAAVGGKTSHFSEEVQDVIKYAAIKILFMTRNPGIIEMWRTYLEHNGDHGEK
jgi:hypothetical protein